MHRRTALRLLAIGGVTIVAACGPTARRGAHFRRAQAGRREAAAAAAPRSGRPPVPVAAAAATAAAAPPRPAPRGRAARCASQFGRPGQPGRAPVCRGSLRNHVARLRPADGVRPEPQAAADAGRELGHQHATTSQIKLNLRKGVTFHAGREFTSDDVKCNFLARPRPEGRRRRFRQPEQLVHASTRPTRTRSSSSRTAAPAGVRLLRAAEHASTRTSWKARTPRPRRTAPVRSSSSSGSRATTSRLTKNQNYWITGQPYLDGGPHSDPEGPAGGGRAARSRADRRDRRR